MKRTIVAILALAVPAVFHAQTATPAQPRSTQLVQTSELQPAPLALVSSAADRTTVATTPVRVSTGVIQPKLVRTVEVDHNRITLTKAPGRDALVVLSMTHKPEGGQVRRPVHGRRRSGGSQPVPLPAGVARRPARRNPRHARLPHPVSLHVFGPSTGRPRCQRIAAAFFVSVSARDFLHDSLQ
jgi:hypothetical protein